MKNSDDVEFVVKEDDYVVYNYFLFYFVMFLVLLYIMMMLINWYSLLLVINFR